MKKLYPGDEKGWTERYSICHGEAVKNQHHILMGRDYVAVTGFGRMHLGLPGGGSLLFHAEGHGEARLGLRAWAAGCWRPTMRVLPMGADGAGVPVFSCSCTRRNTGSSSTIYYNANKAWIPARNAEKIERRWRPQEGGPEGGLWTSII